MKKKLLSIPIYGEIFLSPFMGRSLPINGEKNENFIYFLGCEMLRFMPQKQFLVSVNKCYLAIDLIKNII